MGEVRFVQWAHGALARGPYVQRCLDADHKTGPRSFLYLCGTTRLARWVEGALAARSGGAALVGGVLTEKELLERFPGPLATAPDSEVTLRLWWELKERTPKGRASPTLRHVHAVQELWGHLRNEGDLEMIRREPRLSHLTAAPLRVDALLKARGKEDPTAALLALTERLRADPWRLGVLVVDGFESFPRARAALVERLAETSEECWVLSEGEVPHPGGWGTASPEHESGGPRSVPSPVLERFVRREGGDGPPAPLPHVRLFTATAGERAEVEAIARRVRAIQHTDPRARVLVAVPALPTYAPRFLEIFPRFGLTPEVRRPSPLRASPAAQPVRRLLSLVLDGYDRTGVMELLGDLQAHGTLARFFGEGVPLDLIERRTRQARSFRGREAFTADVRALATRPDRAGGPGESSGPGAEEVAAGFERLFALLAPLERPAPAASLLRKMTDLLGQLGYAGWGEAAGGAPLPPVGQALAKAVQDLATGDRPWTLAELRELSEVVLGIEPEPSDESARLPGVLITGLHDAGLLDVDYLFVGGLSEAYLPSDLPSPLLSGRLRVLVGLPSGEELVDRERRRIARLFGRARRGLFLSYAARSEGEERLPSILLNDFLRVGAPRPVAAPASTRGRASTSEERSLGRRIYSVADAMVQFASEVGSARESPRMEALLAQEAKGPRAEAWRSLVRGLRVERFRAREPRGTPYDGPNGGESARALALRRFPDGRLTAHDIEAYLRCPYRFFLERVLGLEVPSEVLEEADRSAVGTELHRLLFELQSSTRAKDGSLAPLSAPDVERLLPGIRSRLGTFLDELRPRSVEVEAIRRRLLGPEGAWDGGAVGALLSWMAEDGAEVRVAHVELPFDDQPPREGDLVDRAPALPPLDLETVEGVPAHVVGRIDRVGFARSKPTAVVVDDFKTGRYRPHDQDRARESVPLGLELQLPLYLAAVLYGAPSDAGGLVPGGLRYLWLSSASESGPVPFLKLPSTPKEEEKQKARGQAYVDLALRHATNAARGILTGRFPLNGSFTSSEGGCQFAAFCPHAAGCRFHRSRLAGEDPS